MLHVHTCVLYLTNNVKFVIKSTHCIQRYRYAMLRTMPVIYHCMVSFIRAFLCTLLVHVLGTYIRGTFLMLTNKISLYTCKFNM